MFRSCTAVVVLLSVVLTGCARAVRQPARPTADPTTVWLIFVDDLHIAFRSTGLLRNLLRSLTNGLIGPHDTFAVCAIGPSAVAIAGAKDREALDGAIARVSGAGLKPAEVAALPEEASEIQFRFRIAMGAADRMVADVARHPAQRRVMLYLSDGYDVPGADSRIEIFTRAARRARIAVFALNTRVLPGSTRFEDSFQAEYTTASERSLRKIAENTGGAALLRAEDLADAVPRIRMRSGIRGLRMRD